MVTVSGVGGGRPALQIDRLFFWYVFLQDPGRRSERRFGWLCCVAFFFSCFVHFCSVRCVYLCVRCLVYLYLLIAVCRLSGFVARES